MEVNGHRNIKTEVERCFSKRHEGERSTERRSTRPENMENENSMRRLQIWKNSRRKKYLHKYESNVLLRTP